MSNVLDDALEEPSPETVLVFEQVFADFVDDLFTSFGRMRPLALYHRLVERSENVSEFKPFMLSFCTLNEKQIRRHRCPFPQQNLTSSRSRIFIPLELILEKALPEDAQRIWEYLDCFAQILLPPAPSLGGGPFSQVLEAIEDIGLDENALRDNPMGAIMQMMTSGSIQNVVREFSEKVSTGELTMESMMADLHGSMAILKRGGAIPEPYLDSMMQSMDSLAQTLQSTNDENHALRIDAAEPSEAKSAQ